MILWIGDGSGYALKPESNPMDIFDTVKYGVDMLHIMDMSPLLTPLTKPPTSSHQRNRQKQNKNKHIERNLLDLILVVDFEISVNS